MEKSEAATKTFHQQMTEHHEAHAALHKSLVEECSKAEGGVDLAKRASQDELQSMIDAAVEKALNEVQPTLVSKLAPTAPTLIPRPGAGNPPLPESITKLVPEQFQRLVCVDEDDEH